MHQSHAGVYIFLIEGEIVVDGEVLKRRDGMGVYDTNSFELETLKDSHISIDRSTYVISSLKIKN